MEQNLRVEGEIISGVETVRLQISDYGLIGIYNQALQFHEFPWDLG